MCIYIYNAYTYTYIQTYVETYIHVEVLSAASALSAVPFSSRQVVLSQACWTFGTYMVLGLKGSGFRIAARVSDSADEGLRV